MRHRQAEPSGAESRCARFIRDRKGNFATLTAFMVVPLLVVSGGMIDLDNLIERKSALQEIADSAVLSASAMRGATDDERKEQASRLLATFDGRGTEIVDVDLHSIGENMRLEVSARVPTNFLRVVGVNAFDLEITSRGERGSRPVDVALVLDVSGSMNDQKRLVELKKAVEIFLKAFEDLENTDEALKVSIVPFAGQVRAPTDVRDRREFAVVPNPYVTFDCRSIEDLGDREVCETSSIAKVPFPYCSSLKNQRDRAVCSPLGPGFALRNAPTRYETIGYYTHDNVGLNYRAYMEDGARHVDRRNCDGGNGNCGAWVNIYRAEMPPIKNPVFSHFLLRSENEAWGGCLVDRSQPFDTSAAIADPNKPLTLYPKARCDREELEPILGLTKNLSQVRTKVQSLKAAGGTNLGIGVQIGMDTLMPNGPFVGDRPEAKKVMIVLTDGVNTYSRWESPATEPGRTSRMNRRALEACRTAKDADIAIYTVNLIDGDVDLLRSCASSQPDAFNDIRDAKDLTNVFSGLANRLRIVRLTQ